MNEVEKGISEYLLISIKKAIVNSVTHYCEFSTVSIAQNINNNIWHKLSTTQRCDLKIVIYEQLKRTKAKTFYKINESLGSILNNSD